MSQSFTFQQLPHNVQELQQLPEATLSTPAQTAALTILALTQYPIHREASLQMLNFLKGSQPLSSYDQQFLADRFRGKDYVPRSYFQGSSPANNYQPTLPYTIIITENAYSYQQTGYAKLYVQSSGADSPRPIVLRQASNQKWYLWEYPILADIRIPISQDSWV